MSRLVLVMPAVAICLSLAPAAPAPKPPPMTFPAKVGTTWVYQQKPGQSDSVRTVTKVETKEKATIVHIGKVFPTGDVCPFHVYELTPEGWFLTQNITGTFPKSLPLLPVPPDPGWVGDDKRGTKRVGRGWEVVEVPAGKFRAFRVDVTYYGTGQKTTEYYVPGIGEVLLTVEGERWRALKSFTPGKN